MAHENIDERRKVVKRIIKKYTTKDLSRIAKLFNCSYAAICMDVAYLKRKNDITIFPSNRVKKEVLLRDNHTCQYCLKSNIVLFVDHIIPWMMGGNGMDYNLVACCASCNSFKMKHIWIPNNFKTIEYLNPEWANKIKFLSTKDYR